jgi:hypothetical protein
MTRVSWTPIEDEALLDGVERENLGEGQWANGQA